MEPFNLAYHNLCPPDTEIPPKLKRLLGLGLSFCPTPRKLTNQLLLDQYPYFERSLRLRYQFDRNVVRNSEKSENAVHRMLPQNPPLGAKTPRKIYCPNTGFTPKPGNETTIEAPLRAMRNSIMIANLQKKRSYNMSEELRLLFKLMSDRTDLHVLSTDKNLGPAVMTRTQYIDFCLHHLQTSVYKRSMAPADAIIKLLRTRLRKFQMWLAHGFDNHIDWNHTKIITYELSTKKLNRFYALAKVHKPSLGLRPIVSNCNSVFEGLSKWLDFKLQPYLKNTSAYLRDSDALISDLRTIPVDENDMMFTFDVTSLYTSINISLALEVINTITRMDPWNNGIVRGLELLLKNNYFTFGDTIWHQQTGTAMGTPVAPSFATLYLGYIEDFVLLPDFKDSFKYFKRYIDDGFVIIKDFYLQPFVMNRFLAMYTMKTKLQFTQAHDSHELAFLDLWVLRREVYTHRTHQKQLNLYLYIPASSAHPPGVLKGLVYGLFKKYRKQNPDNNDFKNIIQLLFTRLLYRGYSRLLLKRLFQQAMESTTSTKQASSKIFFKVPYDPNGPKSNELKRILLAPQFESGFKECGIDQMTVCFLRPKNLKQHLCPTSLRTDTSPTPAERLA